SLSDHVRIIVEMAFPQPVGDYDHRSPVVDLILVFCIQTSESRLYPKSLKYRRRKTPTRNPFRRRAIPLCPEVLDAAGESSYLFKRLASVTNGVVTHDVHRVLLGSVLNRRCPDNHDSVGIFERKRSQQCGVDQTEDHSVGTDPQGK